MGFTPREVRDMSPWEFVCCIAAHQGEQKPEPPTQEQFEHAIATRRFH